MTVYGVRGCFGMCGRRASGAVWQQHPGVPIGPPQPHAVAQEGLVALIFADDLAGLADSHEHLQALINTVRAELRRWRIKASVSQLTHPRPQSWQSGQPHVATQ